MDNALFKDLHAEGLISDESFAKIDRQRKQALFSVYWELKTLLYLGVVLLTSGLGTLVYKNIDSIGHQAILIFIALVCGGCFAYCFKHKSPFSTFRVETPQSFFDYILLLGTLSFLIFVGYLQYQYKVFGTRYGLATFIPTVFLFYVAYNFDHTGILNLAITNLGIWMGVSVTPKQLLAEGTFNGQTAAATYIGFGVLLLTAAWLTQKYDVKKHFKFSYQHYGIHVTFIALLAGYFINYQSGTSVFWILALLVLAALLFQEAYQHKTFYFLVLVILYSYAAVSCLAIRVVMLINDIGEVYLMFIYFILSAIGLVYSLMHLNKKLKDA